jgi:Plasmid pRiA4b ORF-3-like protein
MGPNRPQMRRRSSGRSAANRDGGRRRWVFVTETEAGEPPVVYQLRVVLAQISPLIWRRLLVTEQTTIAGLHQVPQTAFAWSDEHLHRFTIHGCEYGLWRPGSAGFSHDAHAVTLARFGPRQGERFTYEYDFFDAWRHDIRVEKILIPVPRRRYPVCTGGARAAPPEDRGGPRAFLELRQKYCLYATTARMAPLLAPLLDEHDEHAFRRHVEDHRAEMSVLLRWSRIDDFDRAALNHAPHTDPGTGGTPA